MCSKGLTVDLSKFPYKPLSLNVSPLKPMINSSKFFPVKLLHYMVVHTSNYLTSRYIKSKLAATTHNTYSSASAIELQWAQQNLLFHISLDNNCPTRSFIPSSFKLDESNIRPLGPKHHSQTDQSSFPSLYVI